MNTASYIISNRQTVHILLNNFNNVFCYHVAIIQRLHSCPTVNRVCLELDKRTNDTYVKNTLEILKIYAGLNINNCNDINVQTNVYNSMREWYDKYVNTYIDSFNGYMPEVLLTLYLLPCLYHVCQKDENEFKNILYELNVENNNIQRAEYVYRSDLVGDTSLLKPQYKQHALELYKNMLAHIDNIYQNLGESKSAFTSAVLEVFTEPNNPKTGHAITLIKNDKNIYYILDDNRVLQPLPDYYEAYKQRLWKFDIRDITSDTAAEINNILREHCKLNTFNQFEARVARYTIDFSNNFTNYVQKVHDQDTSNNNPPTLSMAGGAVPDDKKWLVFSAIFVLAAVIVYVVYIVVMQGINNAVDNKISKVTTTNVNNTSNNTSNNTEYNNVPNADMLVDLPIEVPVGESFI